MTLVCMVACGAFLSQLGQHGICARSVGHILGRVLRTSRQLNNGHHHSGRVRFVSCTHIIDVHVVIMYLRVVDRLMNLVNVVNVSPNQGKKQASVQVCARSLRRRHPSSLVEIMQRIHATFLWHFRMDRP